MIKVFCKRENEKKLAKTIYYNEHGQIDRVETIINALPDWVIIAILSIGAMLGDTITGM